LGKVIFESADELIEQEGATIDGFAPGLDQASQSPSGLVIELERAQTLAVILQQRKQHQGIGRIVFGARRAEGGAVALAGGGGSGRS